MPESSSYLLDRSSMRTAFGRAAPSYDAAAVLQREIAGRLLERLDLIRLVPKTVLDAGCGTGHATRALRKRYPRARVLGLDLSSAMLRVAQRQRGWWRRERLIASDVERMALADQSVDLIVSNLTLQWCDLARAFAEFARILRPGGTLLFTSFGPDTLVELRTAWQAVDDSPHVHAFIDMHDIGDALVRARLAEPVMDVERLTMTYPDVHALLRDLKALGAHNVTTGRARGLMGKSRFRRFREAYDALAVHGRIPASYEVVYGHAWAPSREQHPPRVPLQAITGR